MPKLQHFQTSFDWGEVSPKLLSRVDLAAYNKATKTMINAYPFIHGGIRRRPGTLFVSELYNSNQKGRLIPFVFSSTLRFMLVFNGGKIEFIKNGVLVETSPGSSYKLNHTYAESELPDIRYAQSGNTLYLVHPNHPPRYLQRLTDTAWTLTDIPIINYAVSDNTFENAYITFRIINGSNPFVVGQYFTIAVANGIVGTIAGPAGGSGTLGNGIIAAAACMPGYTTTETWVVQCIYADRTRQEWTVQGTVSGEPKLKWKAGDYPQAVAFFEQRLFFAGSPTWPQNIWGSAVGDYTNFTRGPLEGDGLEYQIAANNYDAITHLVSARQLLPMSYSTEFSMAGPNNGGISASSAPSVKAHTFHGSNTVRPIRIGREVIFIQRDGKKARAISYSVTEDANIAPDITLFAEHITGSGIIDIAFNQDPDYIAWAVRNDGVLLSLTLAREYETTAWARHSTDGQFENVEVIPGDAYDQIYFIVRRTINGVSKRYVERLDYLTEIQSDCGKVLTYGSPTTTITGLSHLEGKVVDVVGDGIVQPSKTVSSGQITLTTAATNVKVGLHYDTTIELLNPEFGDAANTTQGRKFSIHEIMLRFQNTINCQVNGTVIPFRTNTMGVDTAISPFTGDKYISSAGWRVPNYIEIKQVTPMPFTLLGVIIKALVNE